MQFSTNLKTLYSRVTLRSSRKSSKTPQRTLQISQPFNFKKEPCVLPGLTESEIFALREKAAASRIAILPEYTASPSPSSPVSRSRCSSPGSARSVVLDSRDTQDFFAPAPPIPVRSARRAASMMVVRTTDFGVAAGGSTTSLPTGCSTPVDLDELFHVGPVVGVVPEVTRGRGRAGWRSATGGSPTRA
ncbi:hypothetical protein QBC39DRAFT_382005 [Podospora conica]|nr:hypothetical protein QBC39DRAFT_382005 [Schizothecium conicum]